MTLTSLLDHFRSHGRHNAPRRLSPRQARRAAARAAEAAAALPTVVHHEAMRRVYRVEDAPMGRMNGAELLAALTDETRINRVPEYLADPYSGATA
jgi:hypothetical protein